MQQRKNLVSMDHVTWKSGGKTSCTKKRMDCDGYTSYQFWSLLV